MPYDGALAHSQPDYNFCQICKERLLIEKDEQDENWYFKDAKAIKRKKLSEEEKQETRPPLIVHSECLRKIEMHEQ